MAKTSIYLDKLATKQLDDLIELWGIRETSIILRRCLERVWLEEVKFKKPEKKPKN